MKTLHRGNCDFGVLYYFKYQLVFYSPSFTVILKFSNVVFQIENQY